MLVCPLCEYAQPAGLACEICGKELAGAASAPVGVEALEGLEPTLLSSGHSEDPVVPAMPDLEPTALAGDAEMPSLADELDALALASEIQATALAPAGQRTAETAPACRYCRAPAAPGEAFCSTCGLKLPSHRGAAAPEEPEVLRRCGLCGARTAAAICPECGARLGER